MGDDFVRYGFPFVDLAAGGSVEGMTAAVEDVISKMPADVKVIPGHGQLSNVDDMRKYVDMLKQTRAVVEKAVKNGKTLDQLKQEKVLANWQMWSGDYITTDGFIETLYNELTGKTGHFMKHN
jgi:glyoxylase-like metal-dependent hydrolase (beta-lactamase superfamily II)